MKNSVSPVRNHQIQGLEAPEIDQKSTENRHRVSDAFFVIFWSKSTLILTSKMEPFGHREPLKNVSKIWPRKKRVPPSSCAALPVAPLPPITCSGKPAPKSDKGNVCADDELESKVGEHKKNACDLHGQCNDIHDFRQVARCTNKLKKHSITRSQEHQHPWKKNMRQLAKNQRGYVPKQPPNYQKSKKIWSKMCSGCFLKANGLQVDARSRNGPEKIEVGRFGEPFERPNRDKID